MFTDLFIPFLVTALLIELTPGPNMAWLALASATHGRLAGLAAVLGIAAGLALLAATSALGLAELAARSPLAFGLLRYVGVAYLLWLAWQTWVGERERTSGDVRQLGSRQWVQHGLLLNVLNPKAAVFFVTVLPAYIHADVAVVGQTLLLSGSYVVIATIVHLAIVLLASQAHGWLQSGRRAMAVRRVFAVLLAIVALWFFVTSA